MSASSIASLASRLTEPGDREAYAALMSYVSSLPPGDELSRLAEMLGLVSLLGQRVPDALGEFLSELRAQTAISGEHVALVEERLAALPGELAAGVDIEAITRAMSEAFRQQIKDVGLADAALLMRGTARDIRAVSGDMAAALRPVTSEYKALAATITAELTTLVAAARLVEQHNARLIVRAQSVRWWDLGLLWVGLFAVGMVCGMLLARH